MNTLYLKRYVIISVDWKQKFIANKIILNDSYFLTLILPTKKLLIENTL